MERTTWFMVLLLLSSGFLAASVSCDDQNIDDNQDCTDIARDDSPLLVFSTLGGGLTAIDPITSEVRWTIDDEPAIKVPTQSPSSVSPYLPDPRDGSLYRLGDMGSLKKLPYTIPQLVASAPCRSSDGILYSGKKKDTWFMIDPKTGRREKVVGFGGTPKAAESQAESIGYATSRAIYLGRTQYTVLMYDSRTKDKNTKPWNITFYDYTSHSMAPEVSLEYEFLHFSGSNSGLTVTLDRKTGSYIWQKDLSSPVVAVFLLSSDGLLSVPFTTVSDGALQSIIDYARDGQKSSLRLFRSLYVGEHIHGLYALPTLIDENTKTISSEPAVRLLDGPHDNLNPNLVYLETLLQNNNEASENVIVLGHYEVPRVVEDLKFNMQSQLGAANTADSDQKFLSTGNINTDNISIEPNADEPGRRNVIEAATTKPPTLPVEPIFLRFLKQSPKDFISTVYHKSQIWLDDQESKILKVLLIILFGLVIAMFWYLKYTVRELRQQSQSGSQTMVSGVNKNGVYHELIDLGNGQSQVGKISFNASDVLGKGCEGTFVFKGTFEKRDVAVKRLLPECFTLADREVALLRESDAHENVVRYFCTEQDRQFRYIAVELCAATLQEYTEGKTMPEISNSISMKQVLRQATNGLMHLHSLNIVHRDIKPQNVLLSLPNNHKMVRAMISDFGLCKKLNYGKTSFSKRSGITGTEGWIAPEMLKGQRTTTAVDIFSLGCVYYYVISNGQHPFGDVVKRQLNILSYEYDLKMFANGDVLDSGGVLADELIQEMIRKDPNRRPTAKAILTHPFFWSAEKILSFLQDVSDRVEKIDHQCDPLKTLEKNSKFITRDDWNLHLDESITYDLRKYRTYQGNSVRDLLRALRNKKHHYHELSPDAQSKLGSLPHGFTKFWIDRFPRLISHSYHALQSCAEEHVFSVYFTAEFTFSKPNYFYEITEDFRPFLENGSKLQRDSPKRYVGNAGNRDYRYKGMDYANFTSDRTRPSKKGTYNFTRAPTNNYQPIFRANDTEITRATDDWHADKRPENGVVLAEPKPVPPNDGNVWKIDNVRDKWHAERSPRLDARKMEVAQAVGDIKVADDRPAQVAEGRRPLEEKKCVEDKGPVDDKRTPKTEDKKSQKATEKKGKTSSDSSGSGNISRDDDKDTDGFTKVRNRKRNKSESQNENVNWVIQSAKESK